MEEESTPDNPDSVLNIKHGISLLDGKAESNPGVRKSSRPRKQSKRILDSAECEDDELIGVPLHKKHRKGLKVKTRRRKDILQNGRPFKCSLCHGQYINNCPSKAKIKREVQPIVKEKFGKLLHLCVKCAVAVNHTENKGPTPEQRAEFEEEGKQFAQHLVKHLADSAAARLYCSFYQTARCGCIQRYITGTPANRKRKNSVSGAETETSDKADLKGEDGVASIDDKEGQTERARYLLGLLKESMAKKRTQSTKTSHDKGQQTRNDSATVMKESEKFILENRVKLKYLNICERGCQKVLCYSNNFLHKKSFGSQPRLQRTKGRAALGRLHTLDDLSKMRCCEKNCVKLAGKNQAILADWRQRAKGGQKEMWKVLEEMLTYTECGKSNCFKFICMVTGCCQTTVQKVYAEILLFRGTSCPSQKEHGMIFHWKRQKGKLLKDQAMGTVQDQSLKTEPDVNSSVAASDTSVVPTLIADKSLSSAGIPDIKKELKAPVAMTTYMVVSSQVETEPQLGENAHDGKADKQDIKEKFLQLFQNIQDPQEIANMQVILAEFQRNLMVKQEREHSQKICMSLPSSGAVESAEPSTSSAGLASFTPLVHLPAISQTPSCSSAASGMFPQIFQDSHLTSVSLGKTGRPFVHIKVPQNVTEQRTSVHHILQLVGKEPVTATSAKVQNVTYSVKDSQIVDDLCSAQADTPSSQHRTQRTLFCKLSAEPGKLSAQPRTSTAAVCASSSSRSSMTETPSAAVSSEASINNLSQQVNLLQAVAPPQAETSQTRSGASQMLSVYPQPPVQIQPLSLPPSTNAQNIQFQLVSPLIIGQPNLMIPLNQPGTMSFILQKPPATDGSQESQSLLQALPPTFSLPPTSSSSVSHKDLVASHVSPMQSLPASAQELSHSHEIHRNKCLSTFPSQTECSLTFSNNVRYSRSETASSKSGVKGHTEAAIPVRHTYLDNFSESAQPHNNIPSEYQTHRNAMTQDDSSSSHGTTATGLHFQGIQPCGQERELIHQVSNIEHYSPSVLLNQAAGNNIVGTTSSCSSTSFVFDALAESPVKDTLLPLSSPSLSSLSLQPASLQPASLQPALLQPPSLQPASLLCEMLMRSVIPSAFSLATATPPQAPVHTVSSQSCRSMKPSLPSSLKPTSSSSAYCQSINFSTHTTPSSLSTQPAVMASKVEQTSLPIAVTIGHNASLSHSQISVSRLNRQRDPPQVGIVHPHVSGRKGSLGNAVNVCSSASTLSQSSVNSSSFTSAAAVNTNTTGESQASVSSSGFMSANNLNVQMAGPVQELSADVLSNQQHPHHQQLLLSLLLNSQNANLPNKPILNIPQTSQFNLSALLGNPGSSMGNVTTASDSYKRQYNSGSQNDINTYDFHVSSQNIPSPSLQNVATDSGNFLQSQTPLSMGSLVPVSIGNQNIVSGNYSHQLPIYDPQMFYSNTGQVKLVPVILSDGNGGSAPSLFSHNGQLLLNMSPCEGFGSVSSISPQGLNRDNSILLNLSPSSGQNIQLQHPVLQAEDIAPTSSALPMASSSSQSLHQSRETGSLSKDQRQAVQVGVLPFPTQHADSQLLAQIESQRNSLSHSIPSSESHCTENVQNKMSFYAFSGTLGSAAEAAPAQKSHSELSRSLSILSGTDAVPNACGQANQSSENTAGGQNVLMPCNLIQVSRHGDTTHRITEVVGTVSAGLPTCSQAEMKGSRLPNIITTSELVSPSGDFIGESRNQSQFYLLNQKRNGHEDQQSQLQSTHLVAQQIQPSSIAAQQFQPTSLAAQQPQTNSIAAQQLLPTSLAMQQLQSASLAQQHLPTLLATQQHQPTLLAAQQLQPSSLAMQQLQLTPLPAQQFPPTNFAAQQHRSQQFQLPLQVVSVVQAPSEQSNSDRLMTSNVGASFFLGQPAFQNFALGNQLHSLISMSNPNQIFLPIQSVPLSSHSGPGDTMPPTNQELQMGQQLSELPKPSTVKSSEGSSLLPADLVAKTVSTHITGTSTQSAVVSSGSQLVNTAAGCVSSSKHRPIRPKLRPIPAPPSKILMLVPDKPGYPAYQLTQVDSAALPFQPVAEQSAQPQPLSQQPQNVLLNSGAFLQKPNSLSAAGMVNQQNATRPPLVSTAFLTQLQQNQQQNLPAQILLLSQPDEASGIQNSETQASIEHQNELSTLPLEQVNINIHSLSLGGKGGRTVSQGNDMLEMISQQMVSIHPGTFQMTSDCDSGLSLLQSGTMKFSSADGEAFQLKHFENKEYQSSILNKESAFVNISQGTLSSDTSRSGTFEASGLQSNVFDGVSQQNRTGPFGCVEANTPGCTTSQAGVSHFSSLSVESSSQVIPVQNIVQTDIQRLNPQIVSQLSSGDTQRLNPQLRGEDTQRLEHNLAPVNSTDGLADQLLTACPQIVQITQPESHQTVVTQVTHPAVQLEPTSSSVKGSHGLSFAHSEHSSAGVTTQPVEVRSGSQVARDVKQAARSAFRDVQKHEVKSLGSSRFGTAISDYQVASSELPVRSQFPQKLMQPSALMLDVQASRSDDIKPVVDPIQYLQCKDVIDLTEEDTPPLSPNSISVSKGKTVGLVSIVSNQAEMYETLQKQIFSDSISSQQHVLSVPFQSEGLAQQSQPKEGLHLHQEWGLLKQDSKDLQGALHDHILTDGSDFLLCSSNKREMGPNVLKLEEIPEEIRQMLLASLESQHFVSGSDVHFLTKAIAPSDDHSDYSFLSIRDQILSLTDTADRNSCQGNVMMMASTHSIEQPQVAHPVAVTESRLGVVMHAHPENRKLSQACRPGTNNPSSGLSSLSATKLTGQMKQEMGLNFTVPGTTVSATSNLPSDAIKSLNQTSPHVVPVIGSGKLAGTASGPPLLLNTTVPRSPSVKAPLSRTVIHPMTSSTVTFIRTNNTPTEAVGPPNITIMSSAQASTSPHLRLRHDNSVSITAAASSPLIISSITPKSVPTMAHNHSSRFLKINSIASVSAAVIEQASLSEMLYASFEEKNKATVQSGRKLSFENNFPVRSLKEPPTVETSSSSLPLGNLLKPPEALTPSRPRSKKKASTIMDLLKDKERLQASALNSSSVPVYSNTGQVAFMIPGTPDVLLMESSATLAGVNPSTRTNAAKNPHSTRTEDTDFLPKQISSSYQPSGFAVLHPDLLPSVSTGCNFVATSTHIPAVTATEHRPLTAATPGSSISQVQSRVSVSMAASQPQNRVSVSMAASQPQNQVSFSMVASQPQKMTPPAEKAGSVPVHASSSAGDISHPNILSGVLAQSAPLSSHFSANFYTTRNPKTGVSGNGCAASHDASKSSSGGSVQESDFKHTHLQDISKSDTQGQFQPIGQPRVASGPFSLKDLTQKSHAESFSSEKLKFKTTANRNTDNGDRQQELTSNKFRLFEDKQTNLPGQNTGTVKKLLLLNEKSAGYNSKLFSDSLLRSNIQISDLSQQVCTNEKHIPQKSAQLLQLMKPKQSVYYTDLEPTVNTKLAHSSGLDKCIPLKLPSSSASVTVSGDNLVYDYSASAHLSYHHQSKEDFKLKDQLPVFKNESSAPALQPSGNTVGLIEASGNLMTSEASSESRMNFLPSQHPILANILFTGDGNSTPLQTLSADSASKLPVHLTNKPDISGKERGYTGGDSYNSDHEVFEHQMLPSRSERHPGNKSETHLQQNFEAENTVSASSLTHRAPPAYSHPPRYEIPKKDMTRVNRVIEDIYRFPDEGEEPSPPPVFGGLKSQFTYTHRAQERAAGLSSAGLSHSSENTHFSVVSDPKSSPKTVQNLSGNSTAAASPARSYISSHAAENSPQTWRNPKKLKAKRDQDRSDCKMNLKKVQFSDVVSSKSAPEYSQSTTVSSSGGTLSAEAASNQRDKTKCPVAQEYSPEDHRKLLGKHERFGKEEQESHIVYEKHPYTGEQLETEFRDGKVRTYSVGLAEAVFSRPENLQVNIKAKAGKTIGLESAQRETYPVTDFESERQFGRETHKVFQHQQQLASVSHTTVAADGEHKFKHGADKKTDPFQILRQTHDNACTFVVHESLDSTCSLVNERTETSHIQSSLKSCENTFSSTLEGTNNQCDGLFHNKVDESSRDLTKRRHAVHDHSLQFSAGSDDQVHPLERNNYITDKREFVLPPTSVASANCERDVAFDQQSSFNILSTQGYSKLSRQRLHRADPDHMWPENLMHSPFKPHGMKMDETGSTPGHYESSREFSYLRCEPLPVGSEHSESPLSRQMILESNFEIARQMKKGHVRILKDSRSEASEVRKMESPQKFFLHPERCDEISGSQMQGEGECQMNKEPEYRTLSGPSSKLTSPIFSNNDARPDVLTSLESLSCLRKEIKDLKGENHYLKLEVARAEQKGKEQQRQRKLSTNDKQRALPTEMDKSEKSYYTSTASISSQSNMPEADNFTPIRKRHTSSTAALNYTLFPGTEQFKQEEGFQSKVFQLSLGSSGIQQIFEPEMAPFPDGGSHRSSINIDDSPEHYIRDTRDPLVSSSMSCHSRPTSQLDLGLAHYEVTRHKYPFSEVRSGPLRSISDVDGFVPLQEHTRHRNLSSSLGFHGLSDIDPPPYELTPRQRNPSASSLKSAFQEADILNLDGARSRNPSSSSWIRYLDYGSSDFAIIRSRNPSGSSNRRSRPGSSSSFEREPPVNVDELPFLDIAHTRSRNSSGESIEPTLDHIIDPQQFMQYTHYTYQPAEAHSKRTKH